MEIDSLFGPVDIAVSGMRAQSKNMEVISSNVANARTTDAGQGEPYRRLEALFSAEDEGITGVTLDRIAKDMSEFPRIFDPGNPNADEQGYVTMPNVKLPIEMMNLSIATRTYEANAAILKRYQRMVETALELLR
jgi:flagellar basal-body rod protein FlgC